MKKYLLPILAQVLLSVQIFAQVIPVDDDATARMFPGASTIFNRLFNSSDLDPVFQKLYALKRTGKGIVTIVHIGDSHIQADYLSGTVRNNLQLFFGNAGRGLVFPYQLAQSNAPVDIMSSSNTSWQYNRLAHPEISYPTGISGFGIQSNTLGASIDISLRPGPMGEQSFNKLKFFLDNDSSSFWILQADNDQVPVLVKREEGDTDICREVNLQKDCTGFSFTSVPSLNTKEFFGVSLENSNPGILYHTIGVNGARYDQYNISARFWRQLPALNADLYIVSLGTNEAQRSDFDGTWFNDELELFLKKLKAVSPNAAVIITTVADSFKDRRPNSELRQINIALSNYANDHRIPLWDLYRITNGFGSCFNWLKRGLMNPDRVHYTGDGYRIQGQLLFNALAKGYNNYVNSR